MEISNSELLNQIQRAKKGEQSAFKYLLDGFWNSVYGFQIKRVKNEYEVEDIVIETFSKAFDKIKTFDERYAFGTWLIAISKNIHIDGSPTPEDILITEQNVAELLRFIKILKPHYQDVINLRYFHEMSYNDISKSLGEPLSNVKVRLLRARKLLAEIITQNNED